MLSVVVPTYNERENIRPLTEGVVRAFADLSESAELLFVDDDSPDGTADEVRRVADELGEGSRVRVICREGERDLAGAVERGFGEAKGDVIAVMDADLSHPPETLPGLLEAVRSGRADVAVASRRVKGGGVSNWPLRRRIISRVAGLLARPLVPVRDATSGFFATRRECIEGVELRAHGYKIGLEILVRGRYHLVEEVPYVFTDRRLGRSKLGGGVMLAYVAQLAALYRWKFPTLVRYLQFALVGAVGMLVDAAVFNIAYWYAGLAVLGASAGGFLAQTGSFVVAASANFVLNRAWTFREHAARGRLSMFMLVCAGGFLLRSGVFEAVVRASSLEYTPVLSPAVGVLRLETVALFSGIAVASVWNFFASRRWAFAAGKGAPARPEPLPSEETLRPRAAVVTLIVALTVLRLAFAAWVDLAADEAYYWQWSRHLDWGYHDHPPMVAYLIAAGTRLAGATELGLRLMTVALAAGGAWIVYKMAAEYGRSESAGLWAAAMFSLAPMFAAGAVVTSPDTPLIFFWCATIWRVQRSLVRQRLRDWAGVGVWLGLGMLSKYQMVLLPVGLLAALLLMREGRRALRTPGPYLAALVGAVLCIPFLVWMAAHGWASVVFQLGHGLGPVAAGRDSGGGIGHFLEFMGSQVLVLALVLFVVVAWAFVVGVREIVRSARGRHEAGTEGGGRGAALFVLPAAVTFVVFGAASFLAKPQANWPAAAHPTLFVLAGALVARWMRAPGRVKKALAWTGIGLAAALSLYVHAEAAFQLFPYGPGPFEKLRDRSELARWADEVRRSKGPEGREARVYAQSYQLASLLAFYLPDRPETDAPFQRGSGEQYAAWRQEVKGGEYVWYFTPTGAPGRLFEEWEEAGRFRDRRVSVFGGGADLRPLTAYYGRAKSRE